MTYYLVIAQLDNPNCFIFEIEADNEDNAKLKIFKQYFPLLINDPTYIEEDDPLNTALNCLNYTYYITTKLTK